MQFRYSLFPVDTACESLSSTLHCMLNLSKLPAVARAPLVPMADTCHEIKSYIPGGGGSSAARGLSAQAHGLSDYTCSSAELAPRLPLRSQLGCKIRALL